MRRINCAGFGLMAIVLAVQAPAQRPPGRSGEAAGIEQLRPQWRVGDQWVVETATLQIQNAAVGVKPERGEPIQWQFTVTGIDKLQGRDCYQIEARPLGQSASPTTRMWVDRQSLALCQLQSQAAVGGQWKTITESYQFPNGQPAPVQGPLSALPIDLPLFLSGGMKGSQQFSYEVTAGPEGRKALGDVGFAMNVQQETDTAPPQEVKGLLGDEFTKDLEAKPVVEVRLKSAMGQVRQLWQAGSPWPVYADNGTTIARLVKTTAARPNNRSEVRP
jgi:hypothetical protein